MLSIHNRSPLWASVSCLDPPKSIRTLRRYLAITVLYGVILYGFLMLYPDKSWHFNNWSWNTLLPLWLMESYCGWMYNQCAAQWVARCTTPKWSYIDFTNGDPDSLIEKLSAVLTSSNPDPKYFNSVLSGPLWLWSQTLVQILSIPVPMCNPVCGPTRGQMHFTIFG